MPPVIQMVIAFLSHFQRGILTLSRTPFGGVKDSGLGRKRGRYSIEEFTKFKWVMIQKGQQKLPF